MQDLSLPWQPQSLLWRHTFRSLTPFLRLNLPTLVYFFPEVSSVFSLYLCTSLSVTFSFPPFPRFTLSTSALTTPPPLKPSVGPPREPRRLGHCRRFIVHCGVTQTRETPLRFSRLWLLPVGILDRRRRIPSLPGGWWCSSMLDLTRFLTSLYISVSLWRALVSGASSHPTRLILLLLCLLLLRSRLLFSLSARSQSHLPDKINRAKSVQERSLAPQRTLCGLKLYGRAVNARSKSDCCRFPGDCVRFRADSYWFRAALRFSEAVSLPGRVLDCLQQPHLHMISQARLDLHQGTSCLVIHI